MAGLKKTPRDKKDYGCCAAAPREALADPTLPKLNVDDSDRTDRHTHVWWKRMIGVENRVEGGEKEREGKDVSG